MEAENFNMKRARKSNRVSWAPGLNLYQVKLFLSEDCPSKVGHKFQDHLQAKASWMLQPNTIDSHEIPPGFEGKHFQNRSKEEASLIPRMKWRCPPRFMLSGNWHVAAGEESEEKDVQKLREMRVLEAVYPHHSSIPRSPSVSMEVQDKNYDDSAVPIVPVIPIEEEESMDMNSKVTSPVTVQPEFFAQDKARTAACIRSAISNAAPSGESGVSPDLNADVVASASAALAAIMKCNEQGNMIDTDLLIKILTDQKMSERLIAEHARAASAKMAPMCSLKPSDQWLPLSGATIDAHKPISRNRVGMQPSNPIPKSATPVDVNGHVNDNAVSGSLPASNQKPCSAFPSPAPKLDMNRLMNQNAVGLSTLNSKTTTLEVPPPTGRTDLDVNVMQNIHHHSPRVINSQRPTSGVKRVASVAFPASCAEPKSALPPIGNGNLHPVSNQVRPGMNSLLNNPPNTGPIPSAMNGSGLVKNANYYKKLIREHGMDQQEILKPQLGNRQSNIQDLKMVHSMKAGGVKPKYQKPCLYFNTPKGCRNGMNCPYAHDAGIQLPSGSVGMEGAKRLRP